MKKKELLERIERLEADVAWLRVQKILAPYYPLCCPPCYRPTPWQPDNGITITYGGDSITLGLDN